MRRRRRPAIGDSSSPSETSVANSGSRRSANSPGRGAELGVDLAVELDARAAVAGVEQDGHGMSGPVTSGGQTPPWGDSGVITSPVVPG